jgi:WD40 repeat protein
MPEGLTQPARPDTPAVVPTRTSPTSPPGYELLDEIGRGGMGLVYRARDVALDRDVAVKLLAERYPADSPAAQRFLFEARITGQLQHPGIPAVHQVGALGDGHPFLAMKLIKGSTLEALLKQRTDPAADSGRMLAIFEAVCQAVGYAHAHRVIHRDLKPANVMVGAFGEVQVMDWGLAKALGENTPATAEALTAEETRAWTEFRPTPDSGAQTQAGTLIGTPAFIPPEQAVGETERVDARADVFGLGALLAVLLTGRPPYLGDTFESVRVQAVRGKLKDCFARLDASAAEPELVALCKKCLAFEPADRPADAGAVAQAVAGLRAAADERARQAELERVRALGEQAAAAARSAERRKRRRVVIGAAAVLAVAVIGGLTAVLAVQRQANTELAAKNIDLANETRAAEEATAEARRKSDAERWQRYRSNLAAAGSALQLQNSGAARRPLEAAPAEYRGWEWLHFTSRLDEARRVLAFGSAVGNVIFSQDGKQVVAWQDEGGAHVWDAATGREVGALVGPANVWQMAFRPDGRRLLAFLAAVTLLSWDPATKDRQVLLHAPFGTPIGDQFSPDRDLLVTVKDGASQLWDVSTGRKRADLPGRLPTAGDWPAVAWSPDGRRLAYNAEASSTIYVWDLAAGAVTHVLRGHVGSVLSLAFSPDGKRLASGSLYPENAARLWDVTTGKEIAPLRGHRNQIGWIAFSPDGTRLATASLDQTARLWDGLTGRPIATLSGHRGQVFHVAFRPDGRRLVTSSHDGTLRLWDAAAGDPVAVLRGHAAWVGRFAFRPDGALLASASVDGTVRLWDMALAERSGVLRGHTSYVYDVAFSPDGTRAASAAWDGTVRLWHPTRCLPMGSLPAEAAPVVVSVCFHPDGKRVASMCLDDHIRVWDADSGKLLRKLRCSAGDWRLYTRATFDPKGILLAAGGADGLIRLWGRRGGRADRHAGRARGHRQRRGLPPGRQAARLRRPGQDRAPLGRGHAPARGRAARAHGSRRAGRLQRRWPSAGLGLPGQDGAPVGRRDRRGAGGAAARQLRLRRHLQPERNSPGRRLRRQHHPPVGRAPRRTGRRPGGARRRGGRVARPRRLRPRRLLEPRRHAADLRLRRRHRARLGFPIDTRASAAGPGGCRRTRAEVAGRLRPTLRPPPRPGRFQADDQGLQGPGAHDERPRSCSPTSAVRERFQMLVADLEGMGR